MRPVFSSSRLRLLFRLRYSFFNENIAHDDASNFISYTDQEIILCLRGMIFSKSTIAQAALIGLHGIQFSLPHARACLHDLISAALCRQAYDEGCTCGRTFKKLS